MRGEQFDIAEIGLGSLAAARHALRDGLEGWGCSAIDDIVLVFSELITNATVHAADGPRAVVTHVPPQVRIEVHDRSRAVPQLRDDNRPGGLGLRIVTLISDSWGWEQTAAGKFVWCVIACGD